MNLAVPGEWWPNFNVPLSWAVANFAKNLLAPVTFVSSIVSSRGTVSKFALNTVFIKRLANLRPFQQYFSHIRTMSG